MRMSLKTIAFLGGAVFLTIPAVISGMQFTDAILRRAETSNASRLRDLGELAADQVGRRMHELWRDMEGMARMANIDAPDELRSQFSLLGEIDPRYSWIGAADVAGTVIAASRGMLEGKSVAERPWFRRGLEGPSAADVHGAALLADLMPPTPEPRRFIDFALPIRGPQGEVTGVLGAHFDWNWVRENMGSFKTPGADILLVSRDRKVLYGPADLQDKALSVGSAVAASQATSIALDELWPDGRHYMTVVVPAVQHKNMPSFGWSLIVRAPAGDILQPSRAIVRSFWTMLGAGLLVSLVLLYVFTGWLATPIRHLAATAEKLANGSLKQPPYEETRYLEASRLSAALVRLQSMLYRRSSDYVSGTVTELRRRQGD